MWRQFEDILRSALSSRSEGMVCAYLFGSHARGDARQGSDIDVAVLFAKDPPRTLDGLHLDMADELTGIAGRKVDLVVLNRAPVDLIHRVLRDGVLLLDRDPSARIRFEVRSRSEYLDLLPFLRRYRRAEGARSP
jgi:predicted nucleotidyltransferase